MQTILIIEPTAIVRELAVAALRGRGYNALGAATGSSAIELAHRHHPDLILMERHLPNQEGLGVLLALRNIKAVAGTPFIMWAEHVSKPDIIRAVELGVRDFLIKNGFSFDNLIQRIQKKLDPDAAAPHDHERNTPPADHRDPPANRRDDTTHHSASPNPGTSPDASADASSHASPDASAAAPGPEGRDTDRPDPASDVSFAIPTYEPDESPDRLLKQLKPIVRRSEVTDQLDDCDELNALPPAVTQVLKLTNDDRCSIDDVARAIRRDQGIAVKILKLANSNVYNRGEPVESLPKAVMRIGLNQIRQTVLNLHVIDSFSDTLENGHLDSRLFWEHSIACGLIASELVQARDGTDEETDTAFTIGLLHDVGRMVYAGLLGSTYEQVIHTATELRIPLEDVESRLLLVNHADAMDRVLRRWRFPIHLIDPIALHHLNVTDARARSRKNLTEVLTLGLANRLAHAMMLGSSGNRTIDSIDEFVTTLDLDPTVIHQIEQRIPEQVDDMKFTLLSHASQDNWPQAAQQARKQLTQPMRLAYLTDRPAHDAFRMFCDQLKDDDPHQPPNFAVARLTNNRKCASLSEELARTETLTGTGPLPLLIISPQGNLSLDPQIMRDRPHRLLREPLSIDRFIDHFNEMIDHQPQLAVPVA